LLPLPTETRAVADDEKPRTLAVALTVFGPSGESVSAAGSPSALAAEVSVTVIVPLSEPIVAELKPWVWMLFAVMSMLARSS
jgi:hypothetical protein